MSRKNETRASIVSKVLLRLECRILTITGTILRYGPVLTILNLHSLFAVSQNIKYQFNKHLKQDMIQGNIKSNRNKQN